MDVLMVRRQLKVAEAHVDLGNRHISRQREIVASLSGPDRLRSEALLRTFEDLQTVHVSDRDRIRRMLADLLKAA